MEILQTSVGGAGPWPTVFNSAARSKVLGGLSDGTGLGVLRRGEASCRHDVGGSGVDRALLMVVVVGLRHDTRTCAYVERCAQEGLSKTKIIRCLKRYLAREVLRTLRADLREPQRLDGP
jgi:hypothetical protein